MILKKILYNLVLNALNKIDPEKAHNFFINCMERFPYFSSSFINENQNYNYKMLYNSLCGLDFVFPVGLAAGFDKNARCFHTLSGYFGFIETGTVTNNFQMGNKKPRIFRLKEDYSIINRMGLPNIGIEKFITNFNKNKNNKIYNNRCILGINIGANTNTNDAITDYTKLIKKTSQFADYLTINVSCPNVKEFSINQEEDKLYNILSEINKVRNVNMKPIFIKISPDLNLNHLEKIIEISIYHKINGIIIGNASIDRDFNLKNIYNNEIGGLTGKAILEKSNSVLQSVFKKVNKNQIILIGSGGIMSAEDAYIKIKKGASLIQVYSGFVYKGFQLLDDIYKQFPIFLSQDGFKNISEAIGSDVH